MEGLPFEVQDGILSFLEALNDIKAIRLLNRYFSTLATPHIFQTVSLTVTTKSFDKLSHICDSHLSQHVRCLHYNIWEAPLILEREWNQALRRLLSKRTHDQKGRIPQYEDYSAYYRGQIQHDEHHLLARAFSRLPVLRSLEISDREPDCFSSSGRLAGFRKVEEAALRARAYVPAAECTLVSHSGKTSHALAVILAHGAATDGSLRSLTLQGFRWHWLDMRDVRMWHEDSFLNGALRGLRCLRLSIDAVGAGSGYVDLDGGSELDADTPDVVAAVDVWAMLVGRANGLEWAQVEAEREWRLSWRGSKSGSIHFGRYSMPS
jgi:hypothetical protein